MAASCRKAGAMITYTSEYGPNACIGGGNVTTATGYELYDVTRNTTDNYRAKLRSGEYIPPLPYYINTEVQHSPVGVWRVFGSYNWQNRDAAGSKNTCFGNAELMNQFGPMNFAQAEIQARLKLSAKVTKNHLNVALNYREKREALNTITGRLTSLRRAAYALRKGNISQAGRELGVLVPERKGKRLRKRLDQFSDNWLELRYGWQPMLFDIYNAGQILTGAVNRPVRLRTHVDLENTISVDESQYAQFCTKVTYNQKPEWRGRYGIGVDYLPMENGQAVRYTTALGLDNPALVAWELVPYSFVVDWFLPIGDALRHMTAFRGLTFVGGYEYWKEEALLDISGYECYSTVPLNPAYWGPYTRPLPFKFERKSFRRSVLSGWSDLSVSLLPDNNLSGVRALDSVTLLHNFLKKFR